MDYLAYGALLISGVSLIWSVTIWRKQKRFDARISKSNFVSQTRFAAEFAMYQDLMEKLANSVSSVAAFSNPLTAGDYLESKQKQYENAFSTTSMLHTTVRRCAPFVNKNTHDKLQTLLNDLWKQITDMQYATFHGEDIDLKDRAKHRQTIMDKGESIKKDFDDFVVILRGVDKIIM